MGERTDLRCGASSTGTAPPPFSRTGSGCRSVGRFRCPFSGPTVVGVV